MKKKSSCFTPSIRGMFALTAFLIVLAASFQVSYAHFNPEERDPYYTTLVHFGFSNLTMEYPAVGEPTKVFISIYDAATSEPVSELDMVHERFMHVFILNQNLSEMVHTHPDDFPDGFSQKENGTYSVEYEFAKAGEYSMIVDYVVNGRNVFQAFYIFVLGDYEPYEYVLDFGREKRFDGYDVTLQINGSVTALEEIEMIYHIEKNGEEVKDLQQFLGSEIHVLAVGEDLKYSVHSHAYSPDSSGHAGSAEQMNFGPNIPVRYTFRDSGDYVIFGQFRHDGNVVTTRFMVDVGESPIFYLIRLVLLVVLIAFMYFIFQKWIKKAFKKRRRK